MKKNKSYWKVFFIIYFLIYLFFILQIVFLPAWKVANQNKKVSPEMQVSSISNFSQKKTKAVAASCGYDPLHGSSDESSSCVATIYCGGVPDYKFGTSQCGGACLFYDTSCTYCGNDALPPSCTTCASGYTLQYKIYSDSDYQSFLWAFGMAPPAYTCQLALQPPTVYYQNSAQVIGGVYVYRNNTAPSPAYTVSNATTNTTCEISRKSDNGLVNEARTELYSNKSVWVNQQAKQYPYTETIKVRCAVNGGLLSSASFVEKRARIASPNWGQPCTSSPNVCGQTNSGVYDENGICKAVVPANPSQCTLTNSCGQGNVGYSCPSGCIVSGASNPDASCITSFVVTPNVTIPNGYTDLSWSFGTLPSNVKASCNVYNVNNSFNPTIIPDLNNLPLTQTNGRITNIQQNTDIELRCDFINSTTGSSFGRIIKKQLIKLIGIQEN